MSKEPQFFADGTLVLDRESLDRMIDVVLAYRPKPKTKAAKKRARRKKRKKKRD